MSYNDHKWQTFHMHIIASNGLVCPVVISDDQLWSRIASMNELVHIRAELRNLGQVYQVMPSSAL